MPCIGKPQCELSNFVFSQLQNLWWRFVTIYVHFWPKRSHYCLFEYSSFVVIGSLFIVDPIVWEGCFGSIFVMLFLVYNLVLQSSRWGRESWYLTVFLLNFSYLCSVFLPYSAMVWSALSDCGISYILVIFLFITIKINQLFCVSCLTASQCTQIVNYLTTSIAIAGLF